MQVVFWGSRGSLPHSVTSEHVRRKVRLALRDAVRAGLDSEDDVDDFVEGQLSFDVRASYGCNTACVEIRTGTSDLVVLDAGTGIRNLGKHLMKTRSGERLRVHLLMTHFHWDHVQGFPFFAPAYVAGNQIHIYGYHDQLEEAFVRQQDTPFFPVPLRAMAADIQFHVLDLDAEHQIAGIDVSAIEQTHPGVSYGYGLQKDGSKIVYSTDAEHHGDAYEDGYPFLAFFRDADLLIFDAPYTLADALTSKRDWGHSSNMMGVELAIRAGVKHLCLFHHEHTIDDHQLEQFLKDTIRYRDLSDASSTMRIDLAWDGLEIAV